MSVQLKITKFFKPAKLTNDQKEHNKLVRARRNAKESKPAPKPASKPKPAQAATSPKSSKRSKTTSPKSPTPTAKPATSPTKQASPPATKSAPAKPKTPKANSGQPKVKDAKKKPAPRPATTSSTDKPAPKNTLPNAPILDALRQSTSPKFYFPKDERPNFKKLFPSTRKPKITMVHGNPTIPKSIFNSLLQTRIKAAHTVLRKSGKDRPRLPRSFVSDQIHLIQHSLATPNRKEKTPRNLVATAAKKEKKTVTFVSASSPSSTSGPVTTTSPLSPEIGSSDDSHAALHALRDLVKPLKVSMISATTDPSFDASNHADLIVKTIASLEAYTGKTHVYNDSTFSSAAVSFTTTATSHDLTFSDTRPDKRAEFVTSRTEPLVLRILKDVAVITALF